MVNPQELTDTVGRGAWSLGRYKELVSLVGVPASLFRGSRRLGGVRIPGHSYGGRVGWGDTQ